MSSHPPRSTRSVLVTGAEGALGQAVARRFRAGGVQVIGLHHGVVDTEARLAADLWIQADLADSARVRAAVSQAEEMGHGIDALIHCAGGFRYATIDQATDEDIDFLIHSNLKSSFYLLREILPGMKRRGFGRIVLISSRATLHGDAGMGVYAATKAGLNALVGAVSQEVKAFDININAVLPTVIDTPANRQAMPGADPSTWVKREELAEILFSLTQGFGKPLNGALIPVSGRL